VIGEKDVLDYTFTPIPILRPRFLEVQSME